MALVQAKTSQCLAATPGKLAPGEAFVVLTAQ